MKKWMAYFFRVITLSFLLIVKVIVSKIAYKSLITTKNIHFLRTDHQNVVHENFFRDFGDIICIKNLFRPIRVINRTNSWAIWTRIGEDINHFSKWPATPPPTKKNSLKHSYFLSSKVSSPFIIYPPLSFWESIFTHKFFDSKKQLFFAMQVDSNLKVVDC